MRIRTALLALTLGIAAGSSNAAVPDSGWTGQQFMQLCRQDRAGCELIINTSLLSMVQGAGSLGANERDIEGFLGCGIMDADNQAIANAVIAQLTRAQNSNLLEKDYISAIHWAANLAYPCPN